MNKGSYGVGLWRTIRMEGDLPSIHSVFDLGDGEKVQIWEDGWPFCTIFPSLYIVAASKGVV